MRESNESDQRFPVPWAASAETSFVESAATYRQLLEDADFSVQSARSRREFAIEFFNQMRARAAQSGRPPAMITTGRITQTVIPGRSQSNRDQAELFVLRRLGTVEDFAMGGRVPCDRPVRVGDRSGDPDRRRAGSGPTPRFSRGSPLRVRLSIRESNSPCSTRLLPITMKLNGDAC